MEEGRKANAPSKQIIACANNTKQHDFLQVIVERSVFSVKACMAWLPNLNATAAIFI